MKMIRSPIIVTVGHIDHGKCVSPDTLIPLPDGRILTAEEIYEIYSEGGKEKEVKDGLVIEPKKKLNLFSFDDKRITKKHVTHLWKLKSPKKLIKIKIASGDEIITTEEHPFFVLTKSCEIKSKRAVDLTENDYVIVPNGLRFHSSYDSIKSLIVDKLENLDNFVVKLNAKSEKFYKTLLKTDFQDLRKKKLFSSLDYSAVKKKRFRAKDYIKLAKYFGFDTPKIYDMIDAVKNSSEKWRAGHTSNWANLPHNVEELADMGYVIGCLTGDGYVSPASGILNKNDVSIQREYIESVNNAFGLSAKVVPQHTCDTVVTNGGKTFSRFLTDVIEFPKNDKSSSVYVPKPVSVCKPILKRFIEGWFDTDGYVSKINHTIEITSKSKRIVKEVGILLLGFGIHSSIYEKNGYFNLRIGNKPYLKIFSKNFNPTSKEKKRRVISAVEKSSTSRVFDLTPLSGSMLKNIGVKESNKRIPYFNVYYRYKRLSKHFLRNLIKILPRNSELKIKLERFLSLPISCVKMLSKETIKSKWDFVYDFTIPNTHNFIAERFIVHNTTLLDKIRGTSVTRAEPGQMTQHAGASYIPIKTVKAICGDLLDRLKIKIDIPGLLFLDTPGHAAFITLRRRGGAVSDLAILVVDITEGFQEQTDESLAVLKEFKTPFVVVATKIDKIAGWYPHANTCFLDSFSKQEDDVKEELDKKLYQLVSQLSERGFNSERFDRIENFTKEVAIVPCSGLSGEGIAELLMVLAGLAQTFLKDRLELSETGRGTVLEVKDVRGLGTTIDVILYDGRIRKGDYLVIGGKEPIATKIKCLLEPRPLQELRVERQFQTVDEVEAAGGIKISAPGLENVMAGSPLIAVRDEKDIEKARQTVQKEVEEVQFTKGIEGIILKADTLGSLEAMIKLLGEEGIPIRKAEAGHVTKQDLVEVESVKDELRKVILAFNVEVLEEAKNLARDLKIEIFQNNIIYRLIDDYKEWVFKAKEREMEEKLGRVARPCELVILKGCVFRASGPAIFGVEIKKGLLKPGVLMKRKDGKIIGRIKGIEREKQTITEAKKGEKVAVSMEEPTIGRQIEEGDTLFSVVGSEDLKILKEVWDKLSEDEKELLK